jgi:hypothetical protein
MNVSLSVGVANRPYDLHSLALKSSFPPFLPLLHPGVESDKLRQATNKGLRTVLFESDTKIHVDNAVNQCLESCAI